MAAEYRDSSSKLDYTCISHIETVRTDGAVWYRGVVVTPNGIVNVFYSDPKGTLIEFSHDDRLYSRRWDRQFQPRYLITLARLLAIEITAKGASDE
jgi:hypothetical protein